jgi:hypothetical protein
MEIFPYRDMTPAAYAARWAHTWGCSDFDSYRYPDPALSAWIDELHRLLRSDELDQCRRAHLTPEEYAAIQRGIRDSVEGGL